MMTPVIFRGIMMVVMVIRLFIAAAEQNSNSATDEREPKDVFHKFFHT